MKSSDAPDATLTDAKGVVFVHTGSAVPNHFARRRFIRKSRSVTVSAFENATSSPYHPPPAFDGRSRNIEVTVVAFVGTAEIRCAAVPGWKSAVIVSPSAMRSPLTTAPQCAADVERLSISLVP